MTSDDKKKSTKKSASKLGHDPLAWLDDATADTAPGPEHNPVAEPEVARSVAAQPVQSGNIEQNASPNTATLTLPVYFGIAQSAEMCAEMQKLMTSGIKAVHIAGGDVESFDTAAVQLMVAFKKQATANSVEFSWSGCSQKIMEVSNLLNIKI